MNDVASAVETHGISIKGALMLQKVRRRLLIQHRNSVLKASQQPFFMEFTRGDIQIRRQTLPQANNHADHILLTSFFLQLEGVRIGSQRPCVKNRNCRRAKRQAAEWRR